MPDIEPIPAFFVRVGFRGLHTMMGRWLALRSIPAGRPDSVLWSNGQASQQVGALLAVPVVCGHALHHTVAIPSLDRFRQTVSIEGARG